MHLLTLIFALSFQAASPVTVAQNYFDSLPIDGIRCDSQEGAVEHIHTRLEIYNRGQSVIVPALIGYPQSGTCIYWIHTHAPNHDGYIHVEAPVKRTFTLGNFFDIWNEPLSWTQAQDVNASHGHRLSIWVNGTPWHGRDPREIPLRDHETIVIQNGPPFAKPAPSDWSNL